MKRAIFLLAFVFSLLPASQVYGQLEGVTRQTTQGRSCAVCKKSKPTTEFTGKSTTCKACARKAAAEKERKEQQAAELRRQQQLEQERIACEQAEKERLAREQAENERIAREQAEKERIAREQIQTFTVKGVSFKMVSVAGGTFTMGATSEQGSDAYSDESPTHQVTVSSFAIGQTEVTQELWEAVMGSNPSSFKGAKRPVDKVSWNDCQTFITKLNQLTGKKFRLPTEAEWEYAARGGKNSKGYKYAGSNTIGDVAWYWDNIPSQSSGNSGYGTQTVGTKKTNELGLYDMSGNVWEWCQDWYGNYGSSSQTNPTGPSSGSDRVLRGGSWIDGAGNCRVSNRDRHHPDLRSIDHGLRLAL